MRCGPYTKQRQRNDAGSPIGVGDDGRRGSGMDGRRGSGMTARGIDTKIADWSGRGNQKRERDAANKLFPALR